VGAAGQVADYTDFRVKAKYFSAFYKGECRQGLHILL